MATKKLALQEVQKAAMSGKKRGKKDMDAYESALKRVQPKK